MNITLGYNKIEKNILITKDINKATNLIFI